MDIEKKVNISEYLKIYGSLLTAHQCEMLTLYYDCDISLFEIAEQYKISRQAVRDAIIRGEKALIEYEQKLHIKENDDMLKREIDSIIKLISENNIDDAKQKLKKLSER